MANNCLPHARVYLTQLRTEKLIKSKFLNFTVFLSTAEKEIAASSTLSVTLIRELSFPVFSFLIKLKSFLALEGKKKNRKLPFFIQNQFCTLTEEDCVWLCCQTEPNKHANIRSLLDCYHR